ncbi:hypothetical protein ACJVDH_13320 [Pedobacter sp. AW1-32]|uniref:hypothetical protein n=1 Tax=Pedobacter sp. AW1-32 TaxID=3383026 RepID=UPI003FEF774B
MEQMNVNEERKIDFDFSNFRLPKYVQEFQPLLYKDGGEYYAVLGPDLTKGITGHGASPEDALIDWTDHLSAQLRKPDMENPVMQFVMDTIYTHKRDVL